jgi:hypothetical protein
LAPNCHRDNWHPEALPSAGGLAAEDFLSATKLMSLDAGSPFAVPTSAVLHVCMRLWLDTILYAKDDI